MPTWSRSGWVFFFVFLGDFVAGQERIQDCEAGLDLRDVNLQLRYDPPDLVITRAHGLPWPALSSPSSADSSASLPATSCRWAIASSARARISADVRVALGLARAAASSLLISPGRGRLAAREWTSTSRVARSTASMPCGRSPSMSVKILR